MKIYFTASVHSQTIDKKIYQEIVKYLKSMGHTVMANHILDQTEEELDSKTHEERTKYYKTMSKTIANCDVVVCEASFPSTISIGHEVSVALDKGKPIIALYQPKKEPGVLEGINSERFMLLEYTQKDLKEVLDYGMEGAVEQIDVRFNFFISPKISKYLDKVSKETKTPRAVYLRNLIEEDMDSNDEYNG